METELGALNELLKLVRFAVNGVETITRVKRFSNNQNLDLNKEGAGKGIRHFTCRNTGKSTLYISIADEREPVHPDQTFSINSPYRVCDSQMKIEFGAIHPNYAADATRADKEAFVRFLVDKM